MTVDPSAGPIRTSTATRSSAPVTYVFSVLPGNGVVGVAAAFKQSPTTTNPHHILITSILQDPNNDGLINTQTVTFDGQVWRPDESETSPTRTTCSTITAYENDPITGTPTDIGHVTWDTTQPGTQPNPNDPTAPYFHQGDLTTQPNYAFFGLTVPLLLANTGPQNVTFQVHVDSKGTATGSTSRTP